jgi:hypothetical protein
VAKDLHSLQKKPFGEREEVTPNQQPRLSQSRGIFINKLLLFFLEKSLYD